MIKVAIRKPGTNELLGYTHYYADTDGVDWYNSIGTDWASAELFNNTAEAQVMLDRWYDVKQHGPYEFVKVTIAIEPLNA